MTADEGQPLRPSQPSALLLGWKKMLGNWSMMWIDWKERLSGWGAKSLNAVKNVDQRGREVAQLGCDTE